MAILEHRQYLVNCSYKKTLHWFVQFHLRLPYDNPSTYPSPTISSDWQKFYKIFPIIDPFLVKMMAIVCGMFSAFPQDCDHVELTTGQLG